MRLPRSLAMEICVLFFGVLKDLVGSGCERLNLPDGATLSDVLEHYAVRIPELRHLASSIALSVNQEYAALDVRLNAGDEVALLPPVSGGVSRALIVHEKIDTEGLLAAIKRPEDGAAVVFDGVVRNNTRGRSTLYLEYEAYEAMALQEMERLCERALAQFAIREARIVHRLGRLEIGETSVLIVVASAHRGSAFDACRWLIDTLKKTVPIWKKEYFKDGAVWADGEAFPGEIPRAQGSHTGNPASK
jgi:molybdopterin synthase catalytic subunit/molybdopterin converting factor small subunit